MALNKPKTLAAPATTQEANGYAEHLEAKPVNATTSVEHKTAPNHWPGAQGVSEEVIPGLFDSNGMSMGFTGSRTLNLGDFNSCRIEVTINVPCSPQNLPAAYEWAKTWVSSKIESEIAKAVGA